MQTPSNANPVEGERHGGEGQTRELQEIPHPIENPDPIQTLWKRSAMASKRNMVSWKEHLGKSKLRGCSLQLNAEKMMTPAVRRRKETAAAALVAAGFTEHPIMARQSTRRRVEVLRAANDGSGIDTLDKPPKGVGSAESCNEEALGERQINLRFSSESRSDEQTQTAEDSGSKQVASSAELLRTTCKEDTAEGVTMSAGSTNYQMMKGDLDTVGIGLGTQRTGEKESNNGGAENSVEDNAFACALIDNSECAAALMENEHSTAYDPPEGRKPEACQVISCSLERETNEQGLLPTDGFTMREAAERSMLFYSCEKKMGEEDDSQVVEDIILLDSRDEKMRDVGSQCSDEKMREYGGLDRFGSGDLGDADSDIIYLEGFPSSDEMEEDDSSDEDAICQRNYSDEETSEDEGSEQHHGFDDNTGGDDACEQPQGIEVDDGNATFKEIDGQTMSAGRTFAQWNKPPSFEAFLCPEDRERILKLGLGTHMLCKKPSGVSWHFFPELPHTSSYYRFSNVLPIEVVHVPTNRVSNENSAEYSTHEEKSGGSDISALSGLLDDAVEVQFERGAVRRWVCVDFSSLSYGKSLRLIDMVVHMCVKIGMKFYPCPLMLARVKPASLGDIGNILLDMRQKILDLLTKFEEEESAVFLLVILPDDRQYDEGIKELCEILKFTYELCYPYHCYYELDWQLKKTARQIQSKVVKRDVRHRRLALPLVSEAPMIIFGADMFHCMPGERSESIATVAASLDWPKFRKYFVSESYQPYGEGIIKDLHNNNGGIMINFFNSFYKRIKQNPQRIIFFRNGLERGQFSHICQQEIDAIKRACAIFSDRYQPQLTYVVVLPTIQNARTDKRTEAGPTKFKFWCCHRGQKNYSSSLVCYHVVHDDNNFPVRELQSLTSKLCTFRHRWANPEIDMVPPAYYAQIAALDAIKELRRKTT